jgi:hypothetical protein
LFVCSKKNLPTFEQFHITGSKNIFSLVLIEKGSGEMAEGAALRWTAFPASRGQCVAGVSAVVALLYILGCDRSVHW